MQNKQDHIENFVIDFSMEVLNTLDRTHLIEHFQADIALNEIRLIYTDDPDLKVRITVEAVEGF